MNDRPASWRMPTPRQIEKLANEKKRAQQLEVTDHDRWWQAVLADSGTIDRSTWIPIQNRRLSEIPRQVLRVQCLRCERPVEIKKDDAIQLYGHHAIWKDIGQRLLDDGCQHRTGRHERDGCWPDWRA